MTLKPLTSAQYDADDLDEAIELCFAKGWTDGLPVVPPTEEKVRRFLDLAGREPEEEIGFYRFRQRPVTMEKVAINAVLAGCKPEYFPVAVAIAETMAEDGFELANTPSTGGQSPGYIVNGPIRNQIGMNYSGNFLGPGNRANATIGRFIGLFKMNVLGHFGAAGREDEAGRTSFDRSTVGQPGKYNCYHIPEHEEALGSLNPLHVELGFSPEQSVVTVFNTRGHQQISVHAEDNAEAIVNTIAHYAMGTGRLGGGAYDIGIVITIPPELMQHIDRDGWSKADLRQALFERTTRSIAWVKQQGWASGSWESRGALRPMGEPVEPGDEDESVAITSRPDLIYIVCAGAPAGGFVDLIPPYGGGVPRSRVIQT